MLKTEMLKSTLVGNILSIQIRESEWMTKTEPCVITKRIPGRGIYRRIKTTRQVPSDEIILLNNNTFVAHPETAAILKSQIARNAAKITNLEQSILSSQRNY